MVLHIFDYIELDLNIELLRKSMYEISVKDQSNS